MPTSNEPAPRRVYLIIDSTALPHPYLAWLDENNKPVTFDTEREAQIEIAEWLIEKLNEFIAGERDVCEATSCTDFVLEVDLSQAQFRR